MASLRKIVSFWVDELRNGVLWVVFWREKRSWHATCICLGCDDGDDDYLNDEYMEELEEIVEKDANAVILNSAYSGHISEEAPIDELVAGVRWNYEGKHNKVVDFEPFYKRWIKISSLKEEWTHENIL